MRLAIKHFGRERTNAFYLVPTTHNVIATLEWGVPFQITLQRQFKRVSEYDGSSAPHSGGRHL